MNQGDRSIVRRLLGWRGVTHHVFPEKRGPPLLPLLAKPHGFREEPPRFGAHQRVDPAPIYWQSAAATDVGDVDLFRQATVHELRSAYSSSPVPTNERKRRRSPR